MSSNSSVSRGFLWIAVVGVLTLLCACGTATKVATTSTKATTSVEPSSTSSSAAPVSSTTPTTPITPAPTTSSSVASTSTTAGTCAERAAETFIYIDSVSGNAGGGLSVIGNRATLVCGGPDDFHWNSALATENATVIEGASIAVLGTPGSTLAAPIPFDQFASYMATDHNSRIFLVTGPLDAITGLQEQFHP